PTLFRSMQKLPKASFPTFPIIEAFPPRLATVAATFAGAPPAFLLKFSASFNETSTSVENISISNSPIQHTCFVIVFTSLFYLICVYYFKLLFIIFIFLIYHVYIFSKNNTIHCKSYHIKCYFTVIQTVS